MSRAHPARVRTTAPIGAVLLLIAFGHLVFDWLSEVSPGLLVNRLDLAFGIGFLFTIPLGALLIVRSVRARASESRALLDRSEQRFQLIADNASDVITRLSADGTVLYVSPAAVRVIGYAPETLAGMNIEQFIHPADLPGVTASVEVVLREGGTNVVTFRARHADGSFIWVETSFSAYRETATGEVTELHSVTRDITQRKRHEQELAAHAAHMSAIIDSIGDAILVTDMAGALTVANRAAHELLGAPEIGSSFAERVARLGLKHPDGTAYAVEQLPLARAIRGEPADGVELLISNAECPEGRLARATARPVLSADGRVLGAVLIARDITDLRRRDTELRKLAAIVEASPDPVVVTDPEGNVTLWNPGAERMYGYPASEAVGGHASQFIVGATRESVSVTLGPLLGGGERPEVETTIKRKDGTCLEVAVAFAPLPAEDGSVNAIATFARDISARKHAELELRESEDRYRHLADATTEGILIHSRGIIRDCNTAFARMHGYEPSEVIGMGVTHFVTREALAALTSRFNERDESPIEYLAARKDGSTFPVEGIPANRHLRGEAVRIVILRDLTERKHAEGERIAIERELAEAQRLESLTVMAGGIAHDFNNLLVAILGNAGLVLAGLPEGSALRDAVADIELAGHRASDLARQMLAFSGNGRFVVESTDLNRLVREMTRILRVSIPRDAALELRLESSLPGIQADATQLRQVVMNLVVNASEAIGDAKGRIHVATGFAQLAATELPGELEPGRYVYLEVSDTGHGMDQETRARVFEPFFTTKFMGRGLGLAAVAGIVRGHAGFLRVTSEPGAGATFRVYLPAATHVEALPPATTPALPASRPPAGARDASILLADDDPVARSVTARMLRLNGFRVDTVANGAEAVRAFRESAPHPDIVMLDLTMPVLGGLGAARQLRELCPGIPILLTSGHSADRIESADIPGLPPDFLQKPYDIAGLTAAVRRLLPVREAAA